MLTRGTGLRRTPTAPHQTSHFLASGGMRVSRAPLGWLTYDTIDFRMKFGSSEPRESQEKITWFREVHREATLAKITE